MAAGVIGVIELFIPTPKELKSGVRFYAFPVLLVLSACGKPAYQGPPALVIGIDGLEWSVMEKLLNKGELPHFQTLLERGVGGSLQTHRPTFSPVLWTTMATGREKEDHGVPHFLPVDENGKPIPGGLPYTSNTRRVPAIWNLTADGGRDVLAVAWWVSWPAEEVKNARIVSSYAAQVQGNILWKAGIWEEGLPELTYPDSLQEELVPILAAGAPLGPLRADYQAIFGQVPREKGWGFPIRRDRLFRVTYHADRTHGQIMNQLLEEKVADLNMVYFGLADVAGHFYWRYREPSRFGYPIPLEHSQLLGDHIDKAYRFMDQAVGALIARVPPETFIMVVSDHGMHAANLTSPKHPQSGGHEDAPDGVIILAGPDVRNQGLLGVDSRRLGDILDVTPTLLDFLCLPASPAMPGKSMRENFLASWRDAHPALPAEESVGQGFRPATPARQPGTDANQQFLQGIKEMGYIGEE